MPCNACDNACDRSASGDVTARVEAWLCELGRIEELERLLDIYNRNTGEEETVGTMLESASQEWMKFKDDDDEVDDPEGLYDAILAPMEEMVDMNIWDNTTSEQFRNARSIARLLTDWFISSCHQD